MARNRNAMSYSTSPAARAVPRGRPARWLCARRPERSGRDAQGGAEGTRPRRHFREAPLHHLQRRSLRAFALAHRRLHAAVSICARPAQSRPAGNHVAIDAQICAGCGQCAAVCPTGAASYALPPADALMRKLRTLLTTYRDAGGERPLCCSMTKRMGGADRCAGASSATVCRPTCCRLQSTRSRNWG